jgi:hypothetical protein
MTSKSNQEVEGSDVVLQLNELVKPSSPKDRENGMAPENNTILEQNTDIISIVVAPSIHTEANSWGIALDVSVT